MREIASPVFLDSGLIGMGEDAAGDDVSRVFSETSFGILS